MKRLQERFRKQNIPVELADVSVYELIAFVREYEALKLEGAPLLAANRYAEKIKEICQSDGDIDLLELEMLVRDLKAAWGCFRTKRSSLCGRILGQMGLPFTCTSSARFTRIKAIISRQMRIFWTMPRPTWGWAPRK